jgi:dephospho-CoA kinase
MIKVGITGGIGSGKTYVCTVFEKMGVPVFYADEEAKKISESDVVVSKIVETFGASILRADNKVDRKKLSEYVFSNPAELQKLNAIIHPLVKKRFENWLQENRDKKYILKEAAILFEPGLDKEMDSIITVVADKETRIERVKKRSNLTEEAIGKIMASQWTDEEKIKQSSFVINNNANELLLPQIISIHNTLIH